MTKDIMDMVNHGLIPEPLRPDTGFIGGIGDQLPDINPTGDWTKYLPPYEPQRKGFDSMNCVQFSRLNVCEIQANFHGKPLDLSDRFLSWLSGCTKKGNTYTACDYHLKRGGCCMEDTWPWGDSKTWEEYNEEPPESVKEEAKRLLENWNIGMLVYVPNTIEEMKKALMKGPLWFCTDVHSMTIYRIDNRIRIFDHYNGGFRDEPLDYVKKIQACYLAPFTPKKKPMSKLPDNSLIAIVDGLGERLMHVDGKLYQDDYGKLVLELMARNSVDGLAQGFPVIHLKSVDIEGMKRYNLKGEELSAEGGYIFYAGNFVHDTQEEAQENERKLRSSG